MLQPQEKGTITRKFFQSGNVKLSYLDFGGDSQRVMLLLHGHMNDARTFTEFASRFTDWRVIGLDQRGHGWSEHAPDTDYSREGYLNDILAFVKTVLDGAPVTIVGHSLGGVNAYQFAARYPGLVDAVIVEDIGVEIKADLSFAEKLPHRSPSLHDLRKSLEAVGVRAVDYFSESVFEDEQGWGFRSDLKGMPISQRHITGEWWSDWLASSCPILLIHGKKSFVLDENQAERMVTQRPKTKLASFAECGHDIHSSDPDGYYQAVRSFLDELN